MSSKKQKQKAVRELSEVGAVEQRCLQLPPERQWACLVHKWWNIGLCALYISAHHVEDEKSMSGEIDGKLWLCVHCHVSLLREQFDCVHIAKPVGFLIRLSK